MTISLTTRYQLPFPNEDDPYQQGSQRIQDLAEKLDTVLTSGGVVWTNLSGFSAGWVGTQAGYNPGQFRVTGGICHLRGIIRYNTGPEIPQTVGQIICGLPATAAGSNPLYVPVVTTSTVGWSNIAVGKVFLSPRPDGIARYQCTASTPNHNMMSLDGITYSVT